MENENGSTQTASETNPPAAAGVDIAALQAKVAELEKQSEGRLRDLQSEREKRRELETKLNTPPATVVNEPVVDELGKVLKPYLDPIVDRARRAEAFVAQSVADKALQHLSKVTGKSVDAVKGDKDLDSKLSDIVRRYGLQGDVYSLTVRACEIMELENLKAQDAERKRAIAAQGNSSLPTGVAPAPIVGSKEYSEEDFAALPMHEYEKLQNSGSFHQNKEGKIVFTPRS